MKAMLLSAGLGTRMMPLTRELPKPLLIVRGKPLIEHHVVKLAQSGFTDVVINLHYLGEKIRAHLGDGEAFGIKLHYSEEPDLLETAGGIQQALSLLGEQPFAVISSDIYTDFDFRRLTETSLKQPVHLMMVDNPEHHPVGDFAIDDAGLLCDNGEKLTWASIGIFTREFFADWSPGKRSLRELFDVGISKGEISGERLNAYWTDVGTPERFRQLQ